ncbi:hypothetical protein BC939DRAFT_481630 [Gamsiella multidivaricata]|uniref:uncharacterized protein n=1 Tax=Gamsiella multidivaricata TaxID=101098 RepID=UPI00221F8C29|nr:uncharacterized protein BC939DRAFT_481630 [Gamsiella multidivaricata]KAI7816907.1 hypothetical protein BC939DRAFT_481630 [Gamsiella multidivaricata]
MPFFDHNEQHTSTAASAAFSSATAAIPMFARSLSAPHLQFVSLPQDFFVPGRASVQGLGQGLTIHNHMDTAFSSSSVQESSIQHFTPAPLDQSLVPQPSSVSALPYTGSTPAFNTTVQQPATALGHHSSNMPGNSYQQPIHPFQMDQLSSSINSLEAATVTKTKFEYQSESLARHLGLVHPMDDIQISNTSLSCSSSSPPLGHPMHSFQAPFRSIRGYSTSMLDGALTQFEVPDEYPAYLFPRHGSLGSLYPMTHSHELLEPIHAPESRPMESAPMLATASSTSITSIASVASMASVTSSTSSSSSASGSPPTNTSAKPRSRRASLNPDALTKVFSCNVEDCGRLFKRSEHLKRHVRSVHTLEKPFGCPVLSCTKRFSRSDNLNQHIRIHRHDREKTHPKPFSNFTPFLSPLGVGQRQD